MNILKSILIAVAVILAIALTGVYFLPNHYSISRNIFIERPPAMVFEYISNYENWEGWDTWKLDDPQSVRTFSGEAAKPAHSMSWKGEKVGEGSLTIESVIENREIRAKLKFLKPYPSTAYDVWLLQDMQGGTRVTWTSEGELSFPIGRLFGLNLENYLAPQKEKGLDRLKAILELPREAEIDSILKQAETVEPQK